MDLIQAEGVKGLSVCAIYTRQSSNTRSDLTSCQIQFEACEAFIRAHKHNGWRWIEEHFNDEGWSGASLDRPAVWFKNSSVSKEMKIHHDFGKNHDEFRLGPQKTYRRGVVDLE